MNLHATLSLAFPMMFGLAYMWTALNLRTLVAFLRHLTRAKQYR